MKDEVNLSSLKCIGICWGKRLVVHLQCVLKCECIAAVTSNTGSTISIFHTFTNNFNLKWFLRCMKRVITFNSIVYGRNRSAFLITSCIIHLVICFIVLIYLCYCFTPLYFWPVAILALNCRMFSRNIISAKQLQ